MALGENDSTEPLFNLDPSDDIQLNVFLLDISKDITDEDLQCMKFLLQGGSKKAVLAEVKTPLELFTHLRQRLLLTRNNLVVLQSFIWNLGNKKIFNKFIDFARTVGDALYFTVPRETPENGYMYLHFHIKGNLETFTRPQLETIRGQICRLLGVPPQFVVVAGLQPSDSLILTLMIPDDCFPSKLDIKTEEQKLLLVLGVDRITMQNGEVLFEDCAVKSSTENVRNTDLELNRLLRKQEALENELEKAHITILQQHRELSEWHPVEDTVFNYENFLVALATVLYIIFDLQKTKKNPRWEESLIYFKRMLRKVKQMGYDEDIIQQLLDAHAMVVREEHSKMAMIQEFLMVSHDSMIKAQAEKISILEYECTKLKYYNRYGDKDLILSENEEFFLKHLYDTTRPVLQVLNQLPVNEVMKMLDRLSEELNAEEWQQIYERETFSTKEMAILDKDKTKLLQIFFKRPDAIRPIEAFLMNVLRNSKRQKYFLAKFQNFVDNSKLQQQQQQQQQAQKNVPTLNKKGRRRRKMPAVKKDNQEIQTKEILGRLLRIEEKLDQRSNPVGSLMHGKENEIMKFTEKIYGKGLGIM